MTPNYPAFSVIMPLYNKAAYVGAAIESVLAQTVSDFELIVVNDASTDGSTEQVEQLKDARIRLLTRSEPGPGGYAARNLGIEQARSSWIAFLDADDEWLPHHLETAGGLIERYPQASVLSLGRRSFDGETYRTYAHDREALLESRSALKILTYQDLFHTNAVLAKKEALMKAGMFPAGRAKRGGDYDLWVRLLIDGNAVAVSPEITSLYQKERSGVIADTSALGVLHPVSHTIQECLASANAHLTRPERRLLKAVSNRRAFKWAQERKTLGVYTPEERRALYPEVFRLKDWARYIRLLLPGTGTKQT